MTSADLSHEQAIRLREQVAARLRWLIALEERLKSMAFPPGDELHRATIAARAAMQDLHVAAHYASCRHGVGKADE